MKPCNFFVVGSKHKVSILKEKKILKKVELIPSCDVYNVSSLV